ncbi:hypothetical protein ACOME3_000381 [Neoechinorhynchus agilis]
MCTVNGPPDQEGLKPHILVDPAAQLLFSNTKADKSKYIATLKITNPHDRSVLFKIRTTKPYAYVVKPNNGLIQPGHLAQINITFEHQPPDNNKKHSRSESPDKPHRFMVQSCFAEPTSEQYDSRVWDSKSPNEIIGVRLSCYFIERNPSTDPVESTANSSTDNFTDKDQEHVVRRVMENKGHKDESSVPAPAPKAVKRTFDFGNNAFTNVPSTRNDLESSYGTIQLILCSLLSFMLGLVISRVLGGGTHKQQQ